MAMKFDFSVQTAIGFALHFDHKHFQRHGFNGNEEIIYKR